MDRIDVCLIALRRILRATELHSKDLAQSVGLTPVQLRVAQIMAESESTTGSIIAKRMHVSQATVTALIDKLDRAGVVARKPDPSDKRQTLLVLTDQGHALLDKAPDALQQKFAAEFEALEGWEQAMLVASLERVAAMLDAAELKSSAVLYPGEF